MTDRIEVCPAAELPPGDRTIVDIDGLPHSVGVFNVDGGYHALANVCPHHLGPLCEGEVTGEMCSAGVGDYDLTREGEVIQCPWHGWKFDIETGMSVFNPHELRTKTYETSVETKTEPDVADGEHEYGTALKGDSPPLDTYDVDVEDEVVVLSV